MSARITFRKDEEELLEDYEENNYDDELESIDP